jgi:CubicO group peptidase (beta-lactamase class C family)
MKKIYLIIGLLLCCYFISCDKNPTSSETFYFTWETSSPEAQGMSSQVLDSAFVQAQQLGFIDGLLVVRNGVIVGEAYYNGYAMLTPHIIMSVTKSVMSAITGLALYGGYIDSLDEKMLDYFTEYVHVGLDFRKFDITLKHLLTMHMGLENEANNNYGVFWSLYTSANWIQATIEYPLSYNPGERMSYNSFQTHLLSGVITKATGMSTLAFARRVLTDPMGITIDYWEQDPQGIYFGGSNMYITPREMATFGYLYLNEGRLNGQQIVPEDWVQMTTSPFTNFGNNSWGSWKNYNYGHLWWTGQFNGQDCYMAYGYGGQFIVNFPDLNLIVVSTAKNDVDSPTSTVQEWALFDIISDYIIPSVQNN